MCKWIYLVPEVNILNGELNKKNLCLAITIVLVILQIALNSSNLFLLLALTLTTFYMFKINTKRFDKISWGGLSAIYMLTFLIFFAKSVLIIVSKYI